MESTASNMPAPPAPPKMSLEPIAVDPYPAEVPLKILLTILGVLLWIALIVSLFGIFYAAFFGLAYLAAQITLIVHLRGSSVKLGPKQLPGLYNRVVNLSKRMGLRKIPDAYLVQSGGVLNAFATKFGSRNFIALYSEIVRSCGDNMDALDFVIGHELGHLHRGHLRWRFLKAPAMIIPFLGTAYYRACEYTCDQYGKHSCGDPAKCLDGVCLLASGGRYAASINRAAFVGQAKDLNTVFMKLGSWFGTHPPLVSRAAALAPDLAPKGQNESLSTAGALLIAAVLFAVPVGAVAMIVPGMMHMFQTMQTLGSAMHPKPISLDMAQPTSQLQLNRNARMNSNVSSMPPVPGGVPANPYAVPQLPSANPQ